MSDEVQYEWNSYTTLKKKNFISFFDIDFSILYRILVKNLALWKYYVISLIYVTKIPTDTIQKIKT